ncbi:hypothetical protein Dvina_47410 [Dactylosporangium vinaceum]|uniref:Carboxypeptidase regulatory-like domain-containing protein n=1 Tax=Dactylosporangium vinaceum TaxID=53362 RepID=A0ABV5M5H2_9ACTN|nr:hypothetical protein [Dactylosporangium vinaceum]UAB95558.1 hypothetical protein Dvina_47410 [Dactylosporangium vinaceum]
MGDLEDDLERALDRFDPVPPHLAPAAIAAFDRRVDAELARLVFDSLTATGARASGGPRLLTFEAGPLTIDVEVSPGRRLVVRVEPGGPVEYTLEVGTVRVTGTSDALGRFAVTVPAPGPFRLNCRLSDADPVVTQWISA